MYSFRNWCRGGGLSLWLALKGANVICSDINGPKKNAKNLHERYGVDNLVDYQAINATEIPYNNFFDIIVFKSVLGGIGHNDNKMNQMKSIKEIYKALRPGGYFLFAENLIGSFLHQFLRKRFIKWGRSWRYISIEEMKEFLLPFESYKYITAGFLGALGKSEEQRNFLGTIDKISSNLFLPEHCKYIIIGIAKK